ncbi:energy transducer TonB [Reichenbachiella sp.]|uniref:energy transducer TonB n=1 Tax=Reichenbachiella sp. TaxID=2184521 RepID=UPI003B5B076F
MKKIILLILISTLSYFVIAQADSTELGPYEILIDGQWVTPNSGTPPISLNVPIGFDEALISNLEYPNLARRMGIEGITAFKLYIDNEGNTKENQVVVDIGADTEKALKSAISFLPTKWIPAFYENEPVESMILVLVIYSLDDMNPNINSNASYKCFIRTALPNKTWNVAAKPSKVKKTKRKKKKPKTIDL